jgi:hypothetical protein
MNADSSLVQKSMNTFVLICDDAGTGAYSYIESQIRGLRVRFRILRKPCATKLMSLGVGAEREQ